MVPSIRSDDSTDKIITKIFRDGLESSLTSEVPDGIGIFNTIPDGAANITNMFMLKIDISTLDDETVYISVNLFNVYDKKTIATWVGVVKNDNAVILEESNKIAKSILNDFLKYLFAAQRNT